MRYNLNVKRHKVLWLSLKLTSILGQIPSALAFLYAIATGLMESDRMLILIAALYLPVSVGWAYLASVSSSRLWAISGRISRAEGITTELDDQLYLDTGDGLVYLDRESAEEVGLSQNSEWSVKLYERSGIVVCAQRIGY